jgi:hypothetical protein
MAERDRRPATYADLEAVPPHLVAEIVDRGLGTWRSEDLVRAPPFDAISFSLAALWPLDKPLGFNEDPQALYAGDR